MNSLGSLLGSEARTEILRVLVYQPVAVGLRHAARAAGVHPHSAELALAGLVREGLVRRRLAGARPLYAFNRTHPDAPVLQAVFEAASRAATAVRSRSLQARGRALLPLFRQASRMVAAARESRGGRRQGRGDPDPPGNAICSTR